MKTVAPNFAADYSRDENSSFGFPETMLLAKIGDDLRDLYADVTTGPPPDDLMRLAHLIDRRRGECDAD
jgi:hypothetical protein